MIWLSKADEKRRHTVPANFDEIVTAAQNPDQGYLALAQIVADVFKEDDAFSVDLLPTKRGWMVTDMALARRSFHWEGCDKAAEFSKE